jgi:hypothetical protein
MHAEKIGMTINEFLVRLADLENDFTSLPEINDMSLLCERDLVRLSAFAELMARTACPHATLTPEFIEKEMEDRWS